VEIDAPVAIYASVIDRKSGDPRTVTPVFLVDDVPHSEPVDR